MWLYILIIAGFLIAFFICRRRTVGEGIPGYLRPFYKIAETCGTRFFRESERRVYDCRKLALSLLILFVGSLLAALVSVRDNSSGYLLDGRYLQRGDYGQGSIHRIVEAVIGEEQTEQFEIDVGERAYNEKEAMELLQRAKDQAADMLPGQNLSLDEVRSDLYFPSEILDGLVQVQWQTDTYKILDSEGHVHNEDIPEEGVLIKVTGEFSYREYKMLYETYVKVLPPVYSPWEQMVIALREEISHRDQVTASEEFLELPVRVDGQTVNWREIRSDNGKILLLLSLVVALVLFFGREQEYRKAQEERKKQLLSDYPEVVSKMTLLLGAGLPIRSAFARTALDYKAKREDGLVTMRYAYEEMLTAYYELQGGVPESRVYTNFGRRCKVQRYLKLSSLLVQNMKKGAFGLAAVLSAEADEAFEEQKNLARKLGEEAGTKLLGPMFLMLIVVLIIIMAPAMLSFKM